MLKKLRNKLLLVNVVSLSLVVAAALSVIYFSAYGRAQNEIDEKLFSIPVGVMENLLLLQQQSRYEPIPASGADASTGNGNIPPAGAPSSDDDGMTISGDPNIPVDYSKSFVANMLWTGQITVFSRLDMSEEDYGRAIEAAISGTASLDGRTMGTLRMNERDWIYCVTGPSGRGLDDYERSIVFLDVDDTNRSLRSLAANLVVIGICAVGGILLVSYLVSNRAIAPVEASMERQRRFVANASHELKTPLAVIGANAEAARYSDDPVEWLSNIEEETGRMGKLIENLLSLAKAEEEPAKISVFDLASAVEDETGRVEAVLFEKGVGLRVLKPQGQIGMRTDRDKLMQAVHVLLENAMKYTPEGGCVTVTIGLAGGDGSGNGGDNGSGPKGRQTEPRRLGGLGDGANNRPGQGGMVRIAVSNMGEYIESADIARIFDRFYRTDKSRNSSTGGHGIGLSIAKTIVDRLGGTLRAESVRMETGGAGDAANTFTIALPAAMAEMEKAFRPLGL
jgi:signal transduction histidine kinase